MKKLILLVFLAIISFPIISQEQKEVSKSKSIEFSSRAGSLIKMEFYRLGKIKDIEFEVLLLTDVINNDKSACLRIKTIGAGYTVSSTEEYIGTLDSDEIDACIKSLTFIKDSILNTIPKNYTECQYKSRDDVRMSVYLGSNETWKMAIQTTYRRSSTAFLKFEDIFMLILKITEAKQKIDLLLKK